MQNEIELTQCPNAVVIVRNRHHDWAILNERMYKVVDFSSQLRRALFSSDDKRAEQWLVHGVSCEVLQPGKEWRNGKIKLKVSLEFCPDEPEASELDSIRQLVTE